MDKQRHKIIEFQGWKESVSLTHTTYIHSQSSTLIHNKHLHLKQSMSEALFGEDPRATTLKLQCSASNYGGEQEPGLFLMRSAKPSPRSPLSMERSSCESQPTIFYPWSKHKTQKNLVCTLDFAVLKRLIKNVFTQLRKETSLELTRVLKNFCWGQAAVRLPSARRPRGRWPQHFLAPRNFFNVLHFVQSQPFCHLGRSVSVSGLSYRTHRDVCCFPTK